MQRTLLLQPALLVLNGNDIGRQYAANLRYANEFNGVRVAAAIGYERN